MTLDLVLVHSSKWNCAPTTPHALAECKMGEIPAMAVASTEPPPTRDWGADQVVAEDEVEVWPGGANLNNKLPGPPDQLTVRCH